MKKSLTIFVSFCLLSSLLIAGISTVQAVVTPGNTDELVAPGQFIGASSAAVEIFGFGATTDAGDAITSVIVTFSGTGWDVGDLLALTIQSATSGIGLYNDDGGTDDAFDGTDSAASFISNVWAADVCTMTMSEPVPAAPGTGIYEWFVVIRTSATIGDGDEIDATIATNEITFSEGSMQPAAPVVADTLTADTLLTVNAGTDETKNAVFTSDNVADRGTVASSAGAITHTWTQEGGPGTITFGSASTLSTTIEADADGAYTIRLTVDDGTNGPIFDEFILTWDTLLTVDAGTDETKNAMFTSDNAPDRTLVSSSAGAITHTWTQEAGPGTITFGSASTLSTTIEADADGAYTIRLTVDDGTNGPIFDEFILTWDTLLTVNAGTDETKNAMFTSDLLADRGTVASSAGATSHAWTQEAGPGTITFGTAAALSTTIEADADGAYTIRLTVDDGFNGPVFDEFILTWDATGPTVLSTIPAQGAADVPVTAGTYTVEFSEPMNTGNTAVTTDLPGASVYWLDADTMGITYTALADETVYFVGFAGQGHQDAAGNPLGGTLGFGFTTEDSTFPVIYNLTWDPGADVSYNNPIQIDAKINETNLKMAGVLLFVSRGGNATLNNYTRIIAYDNASNEVNFTQDQSNLDEYNISMEWDTTCPAIVNLSIGGYFSNGIVMEYINAEYWTNATGVRLIQVDLYFTNETYPDGIKAELHCLENGNPIYLWINDTDRLNATDFGNGTVQLRILIFSLNKTTAAMVSTDVEMAYGSIFDLVDVEFVVDELVPSGEYWIIVGVLDYSDHMGNNVSDTLFTVDNTPPTIELDSPANYSVIINGTDIALTVTDSNIALVTYSANGATAVNLTAPYEIDTTGWADGVYTIVVTATDVAKNQATAEYEFTLDSTLPTIVLNSPDDDSHILPGTTIDLLVTDDNLENVTYSVNIGTPIDLNLEAPYDIDTTGWPDGTHTITVRANDTAGNVAIEYYNFTVDGTAPTVVSVVPADESDGVALDTTIVITFNESMNNVSVQGAISTSPTIANLGFSWNANNTVLTITPPANLAQNTEHTITVGTGAEDLAGNNLAAAYATSFTTFLDTDGDGTPDETDTDDDGDGFLDIWEIFLGTDPKVATSMPLDTDGDGIPNGDANNTEVWMDTDDDGDDVLDVDDADPLDPEIGAEVEDEPAGTDYTMMIILLLVILVIIGVLLALIMRKRSKEEEEPPTEEKTPPEEDAGTPEAPETTPIEESPPETPEASETPPIEDTPPETLEAPETTPTEQPPVE